PLRQRFVAGQRRRKLLARDQSRQQAHGCAGIAHIERLLRRGQAMQADPVYAHLALLRAVDADAHGAEGIQRRQRILTFEKPADFSDALGDRAEHDRSMRNGFIARDAHCACYTAAGLQQEFHGQGYLWKLDWDVGARSTARGAQFTSYALSATRPLVYANTGCGSTCTVERRAFTRRRAAARECATIRKSGRAPPWLG